MPSLSRVFFRFFSSSSLNDCTPTLIRFIPPFNIALILSSSIVPGFASVVISQSLATSNTSKHIFVTSSICFGVKIDSVPPPINIVSIFLPCIVPPHALVRQCICPPYPPYAEMIQNHNTCIFVCKTVCEYKVLS